MKTYIAAGREYIVFVKVLGKNRMISFRELSEPNCHRCSYTTNSPIIAEALEAHSDFNKFFWLVEGEIEKEEEAPAPRVYDKVYDQIHRTQDAKKILEEEYNILRETVKGKADVLAIADELNISFPNL